MPAVFCMVFAGDLEISPSHDAVPANLPSVVGSGSAEIWYMSVQVAARLMFHGSSSLPLRLPSLLSHYRTAAVPTPYAGRTVWKSTGTGSCQETHATRDPRSVQISRSSGPLKVVSGCRSLGSDLNCGGSSYLKCPPIWILLIVFACYLLLESKGDTLFQFLFACTNHEIVIMRVDKRRLSCI
jgi:hypothetical protein